MRVSQEEKSRSRTRIVDSASRLFRSRGVEGASVGDVMKEAGLTHGGFYRHFDSKDALLVAALEDAFAQMTSRVAEGLQEHSAGVVRSAFRDFYLSPEHLRAPDIGCPAAALAGDIARAPPEVRAAFGTGFETMVTALASVLDGEESARRGQAIQELAGMVGAIMLARASDAATAKEILSAVAESATSNQHGREQQAKVG